MTASPRICSFCVMDESVHGISFDDRGECDSCRSARARLPKDWRPDQYGARKMAQLVSTLKSEGQGRSYDVMVGLSGGIDSAYLAYLMSQVHGLRILAVHVDGGWNSESAVSNIESVVRGLGIDLHTYVVEWQEMRDLQLSFLRAGVLNQDIPQDHAFFSTLYRTAAKFGIRTFLSCVNFASESVSPRNFGYTYMDCRHIRAIHRRFGSVPLSTFPLMTTAEFMWRTRVVRLPAVARPLNWIRYDKEEAQQLLVDKFGWRDYGSKHSESRFTKFYQEVYLPRKFGFDKRRLHLSSLIVAGQLARDAALRELAKPITTEFQAKRDTAFVAKKLGISASELGDLLSAPPVPHSAYGNSEWMIHALISLNRLFRRSQ